MIILAVENFTEIVNNGLVFPLELHAHKQHVEEELIEKNVQLHVVDLLQNFANAILMGGIGLFAEPFPNVPELLHF